MGGVYVVWVCICNVGVLWISPQMTYDTRKYYNGDLLNFGNFIAVFCTSYELQNAVNATSLSYAFYHLHGMLLRGIEACLSILIRSDLIFVCDIASPFPLNIYDSTLLLVIINLLFNYTDAC